MEDHHRREALCLIARYTRYATVIDDGRIDVLIERRRVRREIATVGEADEPDASVGIAHSLHVGGEIAHELRPCWEALYAEARGIGLALGNVLIAVIIDKVGGEPVLRELPRIILEIFEASF